MTDIHSFDRVSCRAPVIETKRLTSAELNDKLIATSSQILAMYPAAPRGNVDAPHVDDPKPAYRRCCARTSRS
jgi:hypothetical protein